MSFYRDSSFATASRRRTRAALRFASLFFVAALLLAEGFGQAQGSIRGRVKNLTTGKYLYNAEVTIEETGQSTYTDEYGVYRFSDVPVGDVTVTASFVGLNDKSTSVFVDQGVTATADLSLYSQRYGLEEEEVFELEEYTVDGSGYDSNVIALNEQRASANLKSVQHAEAFGEIAEGNIGEYLKNLPGVSVNYVAADVRAIKLRGMAPAFTQVMVDGSQMASAGSGNKIRSFELEQVSLANVELLEISKLPMPNMPANAIGGMVNLVSKNAFAQDGRKLEYKLSFNFNDEDASFGSTPGWVADGERSKMLPGVELNYSDVFMDNRLGLAMTYKLSNMFNIQQRFRWREWDLSPEDGQGDAEDAYFLRLEVQDGPKKTTRESFSSNVDFKVNDNITFSFRGQANTYDATFFNRNVGWRINPLDAEEMPAGFNGSTDDLSDNSYSFGASRGLTFGGSFRAKYGSTYHVDMGMKHHHGDWVIDYGYSHSEATNHYADNARGFLETWEAGDRTDAEYIEFDQGNPDQVAWSDVRVFDENMNLIPNRGLNLGDFELRRTRERPKESVDRISGLRVNARRNFSIGENAGYFQFGARTSRQERSGYQLELRYEYDGYNTDGQRIWFDSIQDDVYSGTSPGFGYEGFNWPSIKKIHTLYNADRSRWELEEGRAVDNTIGTWFEMEEDIDALYAMGQIKSRDGKLSVLAGLRYEDTSVNGLQPVVSDANFVLGPDNFFFETIEANTGYDNVHPSVHIKYNATKNLLFRISYANTIGRPDFGDMFGPVTIFTPDPDDPLTDADSEGLVVTSNPGLDPRESDNIDLTAEYYYNQTGLFGVSVFQNDMSNFILNEIRPLTAEDVEEYGLPDYVFGGQFDHNIEVTRNAGSAKVKGLELNWRQGLNVDAIPAFLRASSVYANGTFLSTEGDFGDNSPFENDFQDFAKTTVNYGFLFERGPLDFKLRWNIRGDEIGGSSRDYMVNGEEGITALFREERKSLDFDAAYKFNDRATLFVNARNLNDAPHRQGYYLPTADGGRRFILEREERFGVQWTVGVKGEF